MKRALIIVDVQHDFLPGGALGVSDGDQVIPAITEAVKTEGYDYVVLTKDAHPADHVSFAKGEPEYRDGSWPAHCVSGTHGAEIFPEIAKLGDVMFRKGYLDEEAYSGFDGTARDEDRKTDVYLADWLKFRRVEQVDIVGLATDYCVRATAIDSAAAGFPTRVLLKGVRGVAPETTEAALTAMEKCGVRLVRPCPYCGAVEQYRCCEFGADKRQGVDA